MPLTTILLKKLQIYYGTSECAVLSVPKTTYHDGASYRATLVFRTLADYYIRVYIRILLVGRSPTYICYRSFGTVSSIVEQHSSMHPSNIKPEGTDSSAQKRLNLIKLLKAFSKKREK